MKRQVILETADEVIKAFSKVRSRDEEPPPFCPCINCGLAEKDQIQPVAITMVTKEDFFKAVFEKMGIDFRLPT